MLDSTMACFHLSKTPNLLLSSPALSNPKSCFIVGPFPLSKAFLKPPWALTVAISSSTSPIVSTVVKFSPK